MITEVPMSAKVAVRLASVAVVILTAWANRVSAQSGTAPSGSSNGPFVVSHDLPRRELAFDLSVWQTEQTTASAAAGATYTRNLDDLVGIEAAVDVGADRGRPFAVAIAQVRTSHDDAPGLRRFGTIGVARAFAVRDELDVPKGRGLAVGLGLQSIVRDSAFRLGGQLIVFERGLMMRVSCAFVKGFD
jgi:hypothetical protein